MGQTSRNCIRERQTGTHGSNDTNTLRPSRSNKSLSRRISLWTGSRSSATMSDRMETCRICIQIHVRDRTTLCPKGKGGISPYLGLRKICNIPHWQKISGGDRPQTFGPTTELKTSGHLATQSTTFSSSS